MHISMNIHYWAHSSGGHPRTEALKIYSITLWECSDYPSVYGLWAVLFRGLAPNLVNSYCQKVVIKWGSQPATTSCGIPQHHTTHCRNRSAAPAAVTLSWMGINVTRLVALSTTVIIPLTPLHSCNQKKKPMVQHVNLSVGVGRGCSSPGLAVVWSLTLWHMVQAAT